MTKQGQERWLRERAGNYRPTINVLQAPVMGVPVGFVLMGWLALLGTGWQLWKVAPLLSQGAGGAWPVAALVHWFTLGFLTTTMMGLMYQWVPVVFDVPPLPAFWSGLQGATYGAGVLCFIGGLAAGRPARVALGGMLLAVALSLFVGLVGSRLAHTRRKADALSVAIWLALSGVTATWLLGVGMGVGLLSHGAPATLWLTRHIATALVAWVGTLVLGVELKLVPMFAMARADRIRPGYPLALLWMGLAAEWIGAGPSAAVLWTGASLWSLLQMLRVMRMSHAPGKDSVLHNVVIGWGLWAAAAAASSTWPGLAVVLAGAGALCFILGYQSRILPFIVAQRLAQQIPERPPQWGFFLARRLGSWSAPLSGGVGAVVAAAGIGLGMEFHWAWGVRGAGVVVMATIMAHGLQLVGKIGGGRRAHGVERPSTG